MRRGLLLLLIAGCDHAAIRSFAEDRAAAVCAWHARCETLEDAGFDSEDECGSRLLDSIDAMDKGGELDCPGFDQEAADTCIAVWTDAGCDVAPDVSACEAVCS